MVMVMVMVVVVGSGIGGSGSSGSNNQNYMMRLYYVIEDGNDDYGGWWKYNRIIIMSFT